MTIINWDCPQEESNLISEIASRALVELEGYGSHTDVKMDIMATHLNGNPLDLKKLFKADKFNFAHDVFGISGHLNRNTGKLRDCFLPRCSK